MGGNLPTCRFFASNPTPYWWTKPTSAGFRKNTSAYRFFVRPVPLDRARRDLSIGAIKIFRGHLTLDSCRCPKRTQYKNKKCRCRRCTPCTSRTPPRAPPCAHNIGAPQAREKFEDLACLPPAAAIVVALAAAVSEPTRQYLLTRGEHTRGQPAGGKGRSGRREVGGLCSVCREGSKPSVTAEFFHGSSVVSALSRPKIDCCAHGC